MMNHTEDYETKVKILNYMVAHGYHLGFRTVDDFCRDFSVEDLLRFCEVCCGGYEE